MNNSQNPLLDAVSRWAERTPDAAAVAAPDGTLDFRELERARQAITARLAGAGVGPGSTVAVCLGRSRLGAAALLAVWCRGATVVPVDDRHPADRIAFVLRDSGAQVLLGDRLPPGAVPRRVGRIDCAGPWDDHSPGAADTVPARPQDTAYVIYTSGTTGWPKGVEITHAGLHTFLDALSTLDLPPGGTGINAVSPAFDGWLWCALLLLLHGQCMTIVDLQRDDLPDASLAAQLATIRPATVCLTPSLLATCVDALGPARVVVTAGEALPAELARHRMLSGSGRRVLNVYGPTEATIAACWADSARGDDVCTMGRPLPGYRLHVLDEAGTPVGPGVTGELYIGGTAVARGYRNRPDLTAGCFLPDPFGPAGARLYRTGDMVRLDDDGCLTFAGRRDHQVKVRGFRIELGEIESLAAAVPGVRAAAAFVTAAGDTVGLAVLPEPGADVRELVSQVRQRCATRLPEHCRPSCVDIMAVLPTTVTGKIDRAALAAVARDHVVPARAAGTADELTVLDSWSTLLDRPVSDVDANFFELGGHSLLAARVVADLRRRTGLRPRLQDLLGNPTAAGLAAVLEDLRGAAAGPPLGHTAGATS